MNTPGRPTHIYGQAEVVPCGVCKESIRYDSIRRHFKRKHGIIDPYVHIEGKVKKQKTLTGFINRPKANIGKKIDRPSKVLILCLLFFSVVRLWSASLLKSQYI